MTGRPSVVGVILAGGQSRRMGGVEKAFLPLAGHPLIAHAIERFGPQVERLAINANGEPARFGATGLPVIADTIAGFAGPLAGILAGMLWARHERSGARSIVTTSVDAPFLPLDFVKRLADAAEEGIAVAQSCGRLHPVFGIFPVRCAEDLESFLRSGGTRAVKDWLATQTVASVDFRASEGLADPFFNINTPADLAAAETFAASSRLPSPPA